MKNPGIINGIYLGLVLIAVTFAVYFIAPKFFIAGFGFAFSGITLLFYILFMVKAGNTFKAENEGYAEFGQILLCAFLTAFIGGMMYTLFYYILGNYIDPELPQMLMEEMMTSFENSSFMDPDQLDDMREQLEKQSNPSFGDTMVGSLMGVLVGFIISLIIAAIQKNPRNNDML